MKVLGKPAFLFGVQINRVKVAETLTINQTKYISEILRKFRMEDSHGTPTPIAAGIKLDKPQNPASPKEQKELDQLPYKQAIGSLIYLACLTRPDLLCCPFSVTI